MTRQQNPNLEILEVAVSALGLLADELVFIGGCATGLLISDAAAPPIRVTKDVDVITEVASLREYHRLAEQLRACGFKEDASDGAPVCRWCGAGILLDVMPTDATVLGFGNDFYQPALDAAVEFVLPSGKSIRMVTAPYFLATKLVAFDGRGNGDYVMSHDMEDIVSVLDGRPEIVDEVQACDGSLRKFLAERFSALVNDNAFMEAVPGHLPPDTSSPARIPTVEARIKAIAN
jgi:predicted nucleotidyltransferase